MLINAWVSQTGLFTLTEASQTASVAANKH